jgi:hypothetical protein
MLRFLVPLLVIQAAYDATLPSFDFAKPEDRIGWSPTHHLEAITGSSEGMLLRSTGDDPYTIGPRRDFPADLPLQMTIRLFSQQSGTARVYYFARGANEKQSVRADVRGGAWTTIRLRLPALGPKCHIRFNPPADTGDCIVQSISFAEAKTLPEPAWRAPEKEVAVDPKLVITSGPLRLSHDGQLAGGFALTVGDTRMAVGWTHGMIGYEREGALRWMPLHSAKVEKRDDGLSETTSVTDPDGANWRVERRYRPATQPGTIDVETRVTVDQDRKTVFVPMLGVFPGAGSFGSAKKQAIFPGLEYLADETSSSEADVIGPASHRRTPDLLKITFPLMALVNDGRYVGLIWDKQPQFAAVFDSPDRTFGSGGHATSLLFPGSDGSNRVEGNLLPDEGEWIRKDQPIVLHATLIGGIGADITAAVKQYVSLRGLPATPPAPDLRSFATAMAGGWLDSSIHVGGDYRHAFPGRFEPHPAADAAADQDWLALQVEDPNLAARLRNSAQQAIARVNPDAYDFATVSHVSFPSQSLVYGHVEQNIQQARAQAESLLAQLERDGGMTYHPPASGLDLSKTNPSRQANGLTAAAVSVALRDAAFVGDAKLIDRAIVALHLLDRYADDVPRGAQSWEVPLHTPDVLASAYLVRAYTLGYQLTGDPKLLAQAKYWAWTGVPFIYLTTPSEPVGPYASIPVFGATQWNAPVWMGLPVQWCALVYADALYRLEPLDSAAPWRQLADGITASGIQQSWPAALDSTRQGLLPDSFSLRSQARHDPAINPGTLIAPAMWFYHATPTYEFRSFADGKILLHVPGRITHQTKTANGFTITIETWPVAPASVAVECVSGSLDVALNNDHAQRLTGGQHAILPVDHLATIRLERGHN